jgi:hypothetical protein
VTTSALTIAEILDLPPLVPLWPTVGQALSLSESSTYQLAREGRLPPELEVIRLGRRRFVRTGDLHRFLRVLPEENDNAPGYQPGALPSEHITDPTAK